jgi:hypothetical protein
MKHLKELLQKHTNMPFPAFPQNEEFEEWVEDLIEADGYYVGLVSSIANGAKQNINEEELIRLNSRLKKFDFNEIDKNLFSQYQVYIKSLNDLIDATKKL